MVATAAPEIAPVAAAPAPASLDAASDPLAEMIAAEVAVNAMQGDIAGALAEATGGGAGSVAFAAAPQPDAGSVVSLASIAATPAPPAPEPAHVPTVIHTSAGEQIASVEPVPTEPEVVTRISTSGGRHWGINIGRFASRMTAERALMQTMLEESATLDESLRKIVQRSSGYDANFMGLSQKQAELACLRLQARGSQCFTIGP